MLLLIDNYDSFSYNLVQLIGTIYPDIKVIRNDELTVKEIEALAPDHIVVSPGPGRPSEAGVCEEVIKYFTGKVPILGVCLGHQAICETYGATVTYAKTLFHGKQSVVQITKPGGLFEGLSDGIKVARYHSLAADSSTMPDCLEVTALADDGEVMAVQYKGAPTFGVQFHPESIMTPEGMVMLKNFINTTI